MLPLDELPFEKSPDGSGAGRVSRLNASFGADPRDEVADGADEPAK
jgi:hypothetical protein